MPFRTFEPKPNGARFRDKTTRYTSTAPQFGARQIRLLTLTITALFIGTISTTIGHAETPATMTVQGWVIAQSSGGGKGDGPRKPPREAVDACANAQPQSVCKFNGPKGEAIKGTCEAPKSDLALACVPSMPPRTDNQHIPIQPKAVKGKPMGPLGKLAVFIFATAISISDHRGGDAPSGLGYGASRTHVAQFSPSRPPEVATVSAVLKSSQSSAQDGGETNEV